MDDGPPSESHTFTLGKSVFEVHTRYRNLRPVGRGAYGLVAAADDLLTGRKVRGCAFVPTVEVGGKDLSFP